MSLQGRKALIAAVMIVVVLTSFLSLYYYDTVILGKPKLSNTIKCQTVYNDLEYVISRTISIVNGTNYKTTSTFSTTTDITTTINYTTTFTGTTFTNTNPPSVEWNETICIWVG